MRRLRMNLTVVCSHRFQRKETQQIHSSHLGDYLSKLEALGLSTSLQQCLNDIKDVEHALVAINNIFNYCRVKDGIELQEIISKLQEQQYDLSYLPASLPVPDFPRKNYVELILSALKTNDYEQVITHILALNAYVMKQRNGAAWVENQGNKLRVRVRGEGFKLADPKELIDKWDYDYFIGSYLTMARSYLGNDNG